MRKPSLSLCVVSGLMLTCFGCARQHPALVEAEREFAQLSPGVKITNSGIRDRKADRVTVFIQYLHADASKDSGESNIWEMVSEYEKRDGDWKLYQISYNYVGPAS